VIVDCKGMVEQAGEGSRIIKGLGNRGREIEDRIVRGWGHRKDW
jgi:hypothetical protein